MADRMYKSEDGAALRFFYGTERNDFQSTQKGRAVHDKVLYVEIITPGSRESTPVMEVRRVFDDELKIDDLENGIAYERYSRQIKAFLSDSDDPDLIGTPIEAWPAADVALVATLREGRIYTVEALANLPEDKLRLVGMNGRELREKAKAFLAAASGNAQTEAQAARIVQLEAEVEDLKEKLRVSDAALTEAKTNSGTKKV